MTQLSRTALRSALTIGVWMLALLFILVSQPETGPVRASGLWFFVGALLIVAAIDGRFARNEPAERKVQSSILRRIREKWSPSPWVTPWLALGPFFLGLMGLEEFGQSFPDRRGAALVVFINVSSLWFALTMLVMRGRDSQNSGLRTLGYMFAVYWVAAVGSLVSIWHVPKMLYEMVWRVSSAYSPEHFCFVAAIPMSVVVWRLAARDFL